MNYINIDKKRLCGRNNNVVPPLIIDYSTIENVEFTFINSQNQIIPVEDGLSGFYMAGSVKMGEPSCELLFLSKDFQIVDGKLVFSIDTYTQPYLRQIKKKNTEINIEIGQISLESKKIWLRDYALANPRVYVAGLSPQEIESNDYYTKTEVNELIDASEAYTDEQAAAALNDAKAYADGQDAATLASATAYTDEQIEHLEISGYVTDEELESAKAELESDIALKADESDLQLVSGAVDSLAQDITGKAAKADVDIISGKVDGHIADSEIHTTALEKAAWDAKQNAITADNKLGYDLLSGTPTIPTKTSDLANDSGFATSGYVDDGLALKQDIIDESNPISGNAVLVTYDPWTGDPEFTAEAAINMAHSEALQAQADATQANADIQIVSGALDGKLDIPSGGTVGQVVTKTADGAEWAALQIADYTVPDYFTVTAAAENCEVMIIENIAGAAGLKAVLEYSTDGGLTWFNYAWSSGQGTLITLANVGDSVMFRGDNDSFSYNFLGQYYHLWASQNFKASGNLISLLDKKVKKKEAPGSAFIYFFSHLGKLIDASELVLPKGNFSTYFGTFWGCSNLNEIHVNWISWPANTNNWVKGVAASGTFYCPYGLPIIRDGFHIPAGWDIVYTDVPESVLSGAAAATEALTMING